MSIKNSLRSLTLDEKIDALLLHPASPTNNFSYPLRKEPQLAQGVRIASTFSLSAIVIFLRVRLRAEEGSPEAEAGIPQQANSGITTSTRCLCNTLMTALASPGARLAV